MSSKRPDNQKFIEGYIKEYGYHPSNFSAQAYDAPFLLDAAVKAVKGNLKNKQGMIDAMEKVTYLPSRGEFSYNINHIPIQDYYKREVIADENGNPKIVTRGVVFRKHKDAYYKQCKMKRG